MTGAQRKTRYGRVTPRVITQLKALVGAEAVFTGRGEIEDASRDEMPFVKPVAPQVVVKPADAGAVAAVLEYADRHRIPVTPRGGGTGLTGGCIPIRGGIVLSLERMNHILEIDRNNLMAVVEPGVTLEALHLAVEAEGLSYPLRPGEMGATLGGNVATNAGGMNAVKYGVTRHHVLGLEAVLPGGRTIKAGGKYVKSATGYDLTQLILGSEGTLAVVTRINLKLSAKLAHREVLFVPFTDLQDAIDCVPEILRFKTAPIGLEFIEKGIVDIIEKHLGREMPYHQYDAFLLIIMEGETDEEIMDYFSRVEEICRRHRAVDVMVPGSEHAKRRLLEAREKFYHAIKQFAPMEEIDVVVPRSEIARFVKKVKELSQQYGILNIVYGHAGDGNVHLHPLCVGMDIEEWHRRLPRLMQDIYRAGIALGGAISGEHGIGLAKKEYLPLQLDSATLDVMKGIKLVFDPHNILNPGKVFDLETTES